MASNIKTAATTTLKVSASNPATFDGTGYAALSYTTVGEVTDFGSFGRKYNLVKHNPVAARGTVKRKGSFDEGSMQLKLGLDTDDGGQILLKAAVPSDNDYSFLVTMPNGDKYYFQAQVMEFMVGIGSIDNIVSATVDLELTTSATGVGIVEVLAP